MINKRDFLKSGATAIVAGSGATTALAAVGPSLGAASGLASWKAHVGASFEVDGHAVTLQTVSSRPSRQPGEQFSLSFAGRLPADVVDGLYQVTPVDGEAITLYLARTPQGLRADFCRLQA